MAQSRPAVRPKSAPASAPARAKPGATAQAPDSPVSAVATSAGGGEVGDAARRPSGARRALVVLVTAQGAGLLFATVFLFVRGGTGGAYDPASARLGGAMALLGAVALGTLAWAIWRRRKWATSPLVVVELLSIPVAVSLLQASQPGYGVPLLVSALLALVLVAASGMLTARRAMASSDRSGQPADESDAAAPAPAPAAADAPDAPDAPPVRRRSPSSGADRRSHSRKRRR